jgi:hypothetical protein
MSQQASRHGSVSRPYTGALARVDAAAQRISHLLDELRAERERLALAAIDAVDEGHSYRTIAIPAQCSHTAIYKIMTDWA